MPCAICGADGEKTWYVMGDGRWIEICANPPAYADHYVPSMIDQMNVIRNSLSVSLWTREDPLFVAYTCGWLGECCADLFTDANGRWAWKWEAYGETHYSPEAGGSFATIQSVIYVPAEVICTFVPKDSNVPRLVLRFDWKE